MVAPASLPPFQRVLRGSDGFSYQNTVAVWTTDGAWWLGYIQDIAADGQHAYIDFDSSKTAASWVPTGAIWSLAFLFDDRSLAEGGWENMAVQVALRDEMDGPFRFRPATLLNRAFCQIYYVSTAVRGTDSQAGSFAAVEVVDRCQIAAQLPTGELPVQHLSSAVTYTKHVIAFPGAASLLVEAADVSRIITHFRRAYQQLDIDPSANFFLDSWTDDDSLTDGCRFHLRIAKETCDFVIVTGNKDARTRTQQQISSTLNGVLHRHLHSRAQLPPLRCRNVVHISNGGPHSDNAAININLYMAPDSEDSEAGTCIRICHLPQLILMEIFANLDLQAQMLIKRVCSLWHAILSCNPGTHKDHITISLEGCSFNTCQNDHCYKVASMLNRAVSCSSRSLTINGSGRGQQHAFFLEPWLQVTNAQWPLVVLQDAYYTSGGGGTYNEGALLKHPTVWMARRFKGHCHTLILHSCRLSRLLHAPLREVLYHDPHELGLLSLAQPALSLLIPEADLSHKFQTAAATLLSTMEATEITLRRIVLRFSTNVSSRFNGWEEVMSRLMCAINQQFAPVSAAVSEKVRAIHAHWLGNLQYPAEWQRIRHLLSIFSGFQVDGTPLAWDEVDLREMDTGRLSTMALVAISEAFQASA